MSEIVPTTSRARQLRKVQTNHEYELWQKIRNRQLEGAKFRRQVPIGNFIADFACFEKKIIIEVDGGQHNKRSSKEYDSTRTSILETQGYRVLRFWNNEVSNNMNGVLSKIKEVIGKPYSSPHPNLLPEGEGEI